MSVSTEVHKNDFLFLSKNYNTKTYLCSMYILWPRGKINQILSEIIFFCNDFMLTNIYLKTFLVGNLHYGTGKTLPQHKNKSGNPGDYIQQSLTISD